MKLSERLIICSNCKNRKWNKHDGTVCGLTGEKPTFEESCETFIKEEKHQPSIQTSVPTNEPANEPTNEPFDIRKNLKFAYQYDTMSKSSEFAGKFLIIGTMTLMLISFIVLFFVLISADGVSFGGGLLYYLLYILLSLFGLATILTFVNISYQATQIHKLLKKIYLKDQE